MSGTAIIREMLVNYGPVTDLVPPGQIVVGTYPQGRPLPAITVHSISEREEATVARNMPVKMIRERVQVTVLTNEDYPRMKRILRAAALGPGVHTGVVLGIAVRSVLPDGVGPEIPPGDDRIFEQSRDFVVTFIEAN